VFLGKRNKHENIFDVFWEFVVIKLVYEYICIRLSNMPRLINKDQRVWVLMVLIKTLYS
jgi:hypothetical protein